MIPGRLLLGLLPPASAAPPRVLHDALVRAGPETVVHRFESGSSARYFSVVRVGGAKNWPTRETFVFARRASPTHVGGNEHEWVSFWRDCDATLRGTEKQASGCFASSQNLTNVRSPRETNWAHNTALLWDAGAVYASAVAITRRTTVRTPASESESPHVSLLRRRRPRWGLLAHLRDAVPARRGCASLGAFDTAPAAAGGPEGHAGPPRRARGLRRKATAVRAKLRVRRTFLARKTWIDVSPLRARQPRRREGRAWPLRRPVRAERGVDDVPPRPVWRFLRCRRPRLPRALCSSAQRLLRRRYVCLLYTSPSPRD